VPAVIEIVADAFDASALGGPVYKARAVEGAPFALDPATRSALREMAARDAALLTVFAPCSHDVNVELQGLGFELVSVRCTYERPLGRPGAVPEAPVGLRLRRLSEGVACAPEDCRRLATLLGETSRYFKDRRIPRDRAQAIYDAWLTNSLVHGYAAEAVLAFDGDRLAGLVTLRLHGTVGSVDLIGVQDGYRNAGLGHVLLEHGFAACHERGATRVRVVTEAENVAACRFYQRHGFVVVATDLVWHGHPRLAAHAEGASAAVEA
jgi:ribosomal protein S18 acetylase RimI-like enzyme